jgi:DNA (cytosine-5)-methyltransferase 1
LPLDIYHPGPGEILEDEQLLLDGEEEYDSANDSDSDDDLPVRVLCNFTLYDLDTRELQPLPATDDDDMNLGGSGEVYPYLVSSEYPDELLSEDLDSSDNGRNSASREKVILSPIVEIWRDDEYKDQ